MLPQKIKNELKKALQYVETETDNDITDSYDMALTIHIVNRKPEGGQR